MPKVNPEILEWARRTAGLSIEDAASKLNINPAYGKTAPERLRDLEEGISTPSRHLLTRMAKKYHRPLLTFYLSKPPRRGDRGQDFRTLPSDQPKVSEGLLDALIRDIIARQSLVKEAIIDEEEEVEIPFIGSKSIDDSIAEILKIIKDSIGLSIEDYRQAPNSTQAFNILRAQIEEAGVFVLLLGNLGSHHTNIDVETFRGFALADNLAPFIVINDQDSRGAWSFTLIHELTHLILGQTGISGGSVNIQIEKLCNDVASEFLLPENELSQLESIRNKDFEEIISTINNFARVKNISRTMVAYKLYRNASIDQDEWNRLKDHFKMMWMKSKEARRKEARNSDGGPSYYVVRKHRLGDAIINTTARFLTSGTITTTKAGTVLGVSPKNVSKLLDTAQN